VLAEAQHQRDGIRALLHGSEKTVERHRANVLKKLGIRHRVALTATRTAAGLSNPDLRRGERDVRRRFALR
jgi:hypothetical protein